MGILTARLGRLATYQMVARGAAQLKSMGFEDADRLVDAYKEHVVLTTPIIKKALLEERIEVRFTSSSEDF